MRISTVVPLLCVVILAACAAAPGSTRVTATAPEETPMKSSEPTPTPSLKLASEQPSRMPGAPGGELTGFLGADSIEGGCAYLQAADGTRYEVIYPRGWTLSHSPLQLTDPEGEIVARGGDKLTVRGSEASDVASICQIGPIFRAIEVDR